MSVDRLYLEREDIYIEYHSIDTVEQLCWLCNVPLMAVSCTITSPEGIHGPVDFRSCTQCEMRHT